ncbi:hypothetical protein [Pseudomonas sp. ICMP 460]|uniref:hypothetical protein n=1 Tax=Pseudomonas sp. ICMP 460 TaxID=1718917 RepID=UPI000C067ED3|nr:hypothetical protein [Pseudomonas sp. ICMP 460]PHN32116.1 hypothetical protein AO240_08885 [Pseudomonas sp. ICMP 460]
MTDYIELQKAAEYAAQDTIKFADESEEMRALQQFHEEVDPETVLALIAENERLERLALDSVNGEYAANMDLESVCAERDQLRAEVAGLKTGYEAYGRVNAELKAECEALRKYGEEFAVLAERRREEADALRKDSESYRLLSFCHGQGTLQLVRSHHELCAEIRRLKILAGEPVPPTPEEFIGPSPEGPTARIRRKLAAMGKGEQS